MLNVEFRSKHIGDAKLARCKITGRTDAYSVSMGYLASFVPKATYLFSLCHLLQCDNIAENKNMRIHCCNLE
jgi:hypothetical protein